MDLKQCIIYGGHYRYTDISEDIRKLLLWTAMNESEETFLYICISFSNDNKYSCCAEVGHCMGVINIEMFF